MPYRCAFGCKATDTVMHVFPNPDKFPERFRVWVNLVGGNPEDYELYKKKRICDVHFTDEHRNRFKRLNALAVPSLHLPNTSVVQQSEATSNSQHSVSFSEDFNLETCRSLQSETCVGPSLPCTVLETFRSLQSETCVGASLPSTNVLESSISLQPETYVGVSLPTTVLGESNSSAAFCNVLLEHNYSAVNKPRTKRNVKGALCKSVSVHNFIRPLQKKIRCLQTEASRLRKRGQLFKERLANAQKLAQNVAFTQVIKEMTKPAQLFINMQRQTTLKPKGRRFTIEEKILSLSLYKKSPKCYRLLYKYFTLPSSKAMKRLLSQIKITPGINNVIFEKIKKDILHKEAPDRLCSLIFDEMSITPQIFYASHKDELEGFTSNPSAIFSDHVLVFMLKGVKNNFKQPIAYYFTNSLTKLQLKSMLKNVIKHCLESGLIVINTVCDQSPVNVSAINEMIQESKALYLRHGKEWRHDIMRIKGHNIVPLYDTPHLLKGLRNNLLTKDLIYVSGNEKNTVKWDYYQMVYNADKSYGELRLLNKITEDHINKDKINKMRVKSATQLFSHSVAVVTEHLTARGDLPMECQQLVAFTLLIDNVFDSLNVSSLSIPNGKVYKGPVKINSPHHELWQKSKAVLKTIKYVKKVKVGDKIRLVETVVPSVTNLIKTIEGMETLWEVLSRKYGLDIMLTRNFNQDPLENFFGNIRSYGARNIAPNTVAFEGAFKSLLLNNFSSPHPKGANCEEDVNECLLNLDFFLREKIDTPIVSEETNVHFNSEICFDQPHENDAGQSNYVCGWVLRKCLKNVVKGCETCKSSLLDNKSNVNNTFILAKEYKQKRWLCYPSEDTEIFFKDIQSLTVSFLKKNVPKQRLKLNIISFVQMLINTPFKCPEHKENITKMFIESTINVIIYSWCRSINRILSGKLNYNGDDETKLAALAYYNKHKNYKLRK